MIGDDGRIRIVLLDVDGTVTQHCQPIPRSMATALHSLPVTLGFISGTDIDELRRILAPLFGRGDDFYILPEYGLSCWSWESLLYDKGKPFDKDLAARLKTYANIALDELGIVPMASDVFNIRHSQVTISIIGRSAPGNYKKAVDPQGSIRRKLIHRITELMEKGNESLIPTFTLGGTSSIDIQEQPWDKKDGIDTFLEYLKQTPDQVLFIGDGVHPGQNDWPVTYTGVHILKVTGPLDTLKRLQA